MLNFNLLSKAQLFSICQNGLSTYTVLHLVQWKYIKNFFPVSAHLILFDFLPRTTNLATYN